MGIAVEEGMKTTGYLVKCGCGIARCEEWNEWLAAASSHSAPVGQFSRTDYTGQTRVYNTNADFRCNNCRRYFKVTEIKGRVSAHACGAKCMASKGFDCECSCCGKNHGRSYA